MIIDGNDRKRYTSAPKFRMIPSVYFFYDKRKGAIFDLYGRAGRMPLSRIDAYLRSRGWSGLSSEIDRAIDASFVEPYRVGRFNDEGFAAVYTAKESLTCEEEISHYVRLHSKAPMEYVTFSIYFSGVAFDLRNAIASGNFNFVNDDHSECQVVGRAVYHGGADAIAAPSARKPGGNCCAIFCRASIKAGEVIEVKVLTSP